MTRNPQDDNSTPLPSASLDASESALDTIAPPVEPPEPSVAATVRRNVAATVAARVGYMVTRILIPPFVLAHIGLSSYGIWTTVFILVSYFGISTMGMTGVYIKYVAEFNARREYDRINALLSTGLAITLPVCSALFAAFWLGWSHVAPLLHLPSGHEAEAREALLIVIGIFLLSTAFNAFGDALSGLQEIAATQWFWTASYLVEIAAIFVLVSMGRGIRGLAEAYLLRTVVNDGLAIWWLFRKVPWLRISPLRCRREAIGWIVHFGGLVQIQSILSILLASVERVLALFTISLSVTALFDIAKKWPQSLQTLPMAFFGAFLPAASHIDAQATDQDRRAALLDLYLRGSRYANFCTAWFCALMIAIPGATLSVWLGPKEPEPALMTLLFVLFTVGTQWHMLTGPGTSILRGMGRVYDEFFYSVPNIVLLALFVPVSRWITGGWTPRGIACAVVAATAGSAAVLLWRVQAVLHFGTLRYLRDVIVPSLVFYVSAFAFRVPVNLAVARFGRWPGVAIIGAAGVGYSVLAFWLLDRLVLTSGEQGMARAQFRKMRALAIRSVPVGTVDAEVAA